MTDIFEFVENRDEAVSRLVGHLTGRTGIRFDVVDDSWERQFGTDGRQFVAIVADGMAVAAIVPAQRGFGGSPSIGVFTIPDGWTPEADPNGDLADPIVFYHYEAPGTGASVFADCERAAAQAVGLPAPLDRNAGVLGGHWESTHP